MKDLNQVEPRKYSLVCHSVPEQLSSIYLQDVMYVIVNLEPQYYLKAAADGLSLESMGLRLSLLSSILSLYLQTQKI